MADSIRLKIDVSGLSDKIRQRLETISNPDYLLRPICFDLTALMTERIHDKGQDSNDTPIGTYSKGYLKVRQEKFNRTADTKVIISATRQLENDWSVIAVKGGYGIGFKNTFNYKKSQWVEANYKKPIFSLSESERQYVNKRFEELFQEALQ